jgi:hypothetical protein
MSYTELLTAVFNPEPRFGLRVKANSVCPSCLGNKSRKSTLCHDCYHTAKHLTIYARTLKYKGKEDTNA